MTRTEALAIITSRLATADDAALEAVAAELVQTQQLTADGILEVLTPESVLPRALTATELASIQASKEDFAAGRTLSIAELDTYLDHRARDRTTTGGL